MRQDAENHRGKSGKNGKYTKTERVHGRHESGIMTAKYRDDRGGSGTGLRSGNEFGLNDFELTFIMH